MSKNRLGETKGAVDVLVHINVNYIHIPIASTDVHPGINLAQDAKAEDHCKKQDDKPLTQINRLLMTNPPRLAATYFEHFDACAGYPFIDS